MEKKEASLKQENMISNYLGWRRIPGSGARPFAPGDISSKHWLGECKTHTEPEHNIIFKLDVWDKICDEAASRFKRPALFVDDGSQTVKNTYCMFDATADLENYIDQCELNVLDHKKSISLKYPVSDEDSSKSLLYQRKGKILCILSLERFKQYLEIGA